MAHTRYAWVTIVLVAMQLACAGASAGDAYAEDVLALNEDASHLVADVDGRAGKVSLVEEAESSEAGEGCDATLKLAKECASTLRRSHTFLKKMEMEAVELDTALNKAKNDVDAKKAKKPAAEEAMLGEIKAVSHRIGESMSAPEPSYCLDTRVALKKCHNQLFKVTAFIERVGTNGGLPRAGMPGSDQPNIPKVAAKPKPKKGSTADVIYKNITMSKVEIKEAEDLCKNIKESEVKADTEAYKKKDLAGADSEFKEETNTRISMLLQQRVNFFASERKNKKITEPIPAPEKLPKCQGCWYRRRRAGRQGEINSCPPLPPKMKMPKLPKSPKPKEKAAAAPVPKDTPEDKDVSKGEKNETPKTEKEKNATNATSVPKANSTKYVATDLVGYQTPITAQGKFFYAGLSYQGKGAWSCNAKAGAEVSCSEEGSLPCELKGPNPDLTQCQKRCDKCKKCIGFNYVRNPVTKKEGNGNGGICVFYSKDPVKAKVPSKSCAPLNTAKYPKAGCKDPMKDKDFFCCTEASFFVKKVPRKVKCLACCNAVKAADRCDGPQCEHCIMNEKPVGSCAAARKCCKATPPCADKTCLDCPPPVNDGYVKKFNAGGGVTLKYNIPQPNMDGPWKLDNYILQDKYQKKFYLGALNYKSVGKYTCNLHFATNVRSPDVCTAQPKVSKLQDCKMYCDNKLDCWGFNIIFNKYNTKYMGNSANDGGICIFLKDDPERSKVKSVNCAGWQGKKPLCVNPGSDAAWNCCSEGYFYKKKAPVPKCTAWQEGSGEKKKELQCHFPFKHKGKSYNHCIVNDSKTGAAWCTVNAGTGAWGYCNPKTCKAAGVKVDQTRPGSAAANAESRKAKAKMAKALQPAAAEVIELK